MTGHFIDLQVEVADTFWKRLRGWIGRTTIDSHEALLIPRCRRVHTFFMRMPIDIVMLDQYYRVVRVQTSVPPWRIVGGDFKVAACLELSAHTARDFGMAPGRKLQCEQAGDGQILGRMV